MLNYIKTKFINQVIRIREWRDAYLFDKYKKKALIPFDEDWFKGKRVAIIGGADSAYKEKLGDYIDGFDVVVRVNNGVRVIDKYKEYIGKRTDFLFHTLYTNIEGGGGPIELELWKQHDVKRIVFSHHSESEYGQNLTQFLLTTKGEDKIVEFGKELYLANMQTISPYHPTTGLIAISTIYSCAPSLLYITGITFFRTAHQQDYRKGNLNFWIQNMKSSESKHNPDAEYSFFRELYTKDSSLFKLDKTLQEILDNDKS